MVRAVGDISERHINKLDHKRRARLKLPAPGRREQITKKDIDLKQVFELARLMCSQAEIGAVLGIGQSGVQALSDRWPEFAEALDTGYNETRKTLRKTQLDLALSGHPSMLMWLGKQYLGQADKHEQHNKTEVSITVQRAMDELRNIPRGQLLEAHALLSVQATSEAEVDSGDA